MCNDYGNHISYRNCRASFSQARIPIKWPNAAPNLEPRDDIWPTDKAPVIRRLEDGTNEVSEIRWGFAPGEACSWDIVAMASTIPAERLTEPVYRPG